MFRYHTKCRACGSSTSLREVADFGLTPLVNSFKARDEIQTGYAPLKILLCEECWLPQLSVVVDPHILYDHYTYAHSTTSTLRHHFGILADILHDQRPSLGRILEIGSNDGLLLEYLRTKPDVDFVMGVDPAANLAEVAILKGIQTRIALFGTEVAEHLHEYFKPFDVVLARHVFAHTDNWKDVLDGIATITHNQSIVALEVQYAPDLLERVEWDQVYHEHLSYVTLTGLAAALANTYWRLHDVVRVDYNGGSVVIILRHVESGIAPSPRVLEMISKEPRGLTPWYDFHKKASTLIQKLSDEVRWRAVSGIRVGGYGAPAKATNWVHQCNLSHRELIFITDSAPLKQGKLVPGSDIEIVAPEMMKTAKPDCMVMFAWNFESEILRKEADFINGGGKFIVPLPTIRIVP